MCWQGDKGDDQVLNLTAHNLLSSKLFKHSKLEQITTEHPEQIPYANAFLDQKTRPLCCNCSSLMRLLTPPFRKANWHESHPSINIAVYTQHPPVNSPSSLVVSDFKVYQMGSLKMVTLFHSGTWQDAYATICASQYTAVRRVQQVYPLKVVSC